MDAFTVYPAIDLRAGKVVRLAQGDPTRQTLYGDQPAETARRWLDAGASWLHVVNLDGAFGDRDAANRDALRAILDTGGKVQFGGGLRSLDDVENALSLGVRRVILGTVAVESPELVAEAIARFGAKAVGVGIDARDDRVRVRGWVQETALSPIDLGRQLSRAGVRTVVYTNIARDGVGRGVDVAGAQRLAEAAGLSAIASGGVASLDDVRRVREAGLSGVIVGRALYEGQIDLKEALQC
ncbi:MAG: 1-(5-phosphoribosyl)-5-[(5-phosphoribosylamino)methylideneamino]imidazole-4-carboxamide isomerase [Chloroflexi bacterium]|nr:1-(5-phosphoribosyl)-5-[(5-phosphoribosylamino)methylideneamino]imidazole-4-carboxamide isomerase [Chloroflexota bacterium]